MKTFSAFPRAAAWLACLAVFAAVTQPALAIADLTARAVSSTEILLTWNRSGFDYRPYYLSRTGPDGKSYQLAYVDGMSFSDRALEPDTTYTYTVTSTDFFGGNQSQTIVATGHTLGWQNRDVGQVGAAGSVQRSGEVIAVTGSGADIDGNADAFHFVHQSFTGDGVLIVRVNSVANTAAWAKAGIMFRESLAPGVRYVMAAANPAGDSAIQSRATTDGPSEFAGGIYSARPEWLKLSRRGNVFEASQSSDGIRWVSLGSVTLDLPATLYAGLAVTSHAAGVPCTAMFDGFNLSTWDGAGGTVERVAVVPHATFIDFSWTNSTFGAANSMLLELSRDNFRTVATTFATNQYIGTLGNLYPIANIEPNTTYYVRVRPFLPDGMGLSSPIFMTTTLPAPAGAVPAAPTSLSANVVSSSQVNLMWADNSNNETGFLIERSTDGINFSSATPFYAGANATSAVLSQLLPNTTYYFRVRALNRDFRENYLSASANIVTATTSLTPTGAPFNLTQPFDVTGSLAGFTKLSAAAEGASTYQWLRNGLALSDGTESEYKFFALQPAQTGIYNVVFSGAGGSVTSDPATVGLILSTNTKVAGAAREVGSDIRHPNGNIYDQVLLEGPAASVRADPGQVTRLSYLDLNDDIVQVEFSGAGTLSLTLDDASGPAPAPKYNQPDVSYMKGHATIVIAAADETTNVSVFSVGRANAINQALFRPGESYDGIADLATLAIVRGNGRFGGIYAGDAHFFATRSLTGIYAPNVQFDGPVTVSDITASDNAAPMLFLGQATVVRVAGGNLAQPNNRPVQVGMFSRVQFIDGTTSSGRTLPAQTIQGRLEQNGRDVTAAMTASAP